MKHRKQNREQNFHGYCLVSSNYSEYVWFGFYSRPPHDYKGINSNMKREATKWSFHVIVSFCCDFANCDAKPNTRTLQLNRTTPSKYKLKQFKNQAGCKIDEKD